MEATPDLLFGKIAIKSGFFDARQLETLLQEQAQLAKAGARMSLGDLCLKRGLLTHEQVKALLLAQQFREMREEDRLIGQLAIKNGFTNDEEVKLALDEQKQAYQSEKRLPPKLGEILVEMGSLTRQQLEALLTAQERLNTSRPEVVSEESKEGAKMGVPAKIPCPLCGYLVFPTAVKCPKCKGSIGSRPCPSCQEAVPGDAVACPHCDTPLKAQVHQGQPNAAPVVVVAQQQGAAPRRGVNHALHGIITLLSCGLWLPVWIIVAIANRD
jgi:hypothetical protein